MASNEELDSSGLARRAFRGGSILLPREDPQTEHPRDARHWIAIYTELVNFKDSLLERLDDSVDALSPEARTEILGSDIAALREQRGRYVDRLEFWQGRHLQLQGLELDQAGRLLRYRGKEVELTRRESQLLARLLMTPDSFHTIEEITEEAWGNHSIFPEQVRTYIGRIRRKLAEVDAPYEVVNRARHGYGLRLR